MRKFIKENWTDPVWSKVFAGIILAVLGAIALSVYKQIPISEIYEELQNSRITINYLTIFITVILILAVTIPAVYFSIKKSNLPPSA